MQSNSGSQRISESSLESEENSGVYSTLANYGRTIVNMIGYRIFKTKDRDGKGSSLDTRTDRSNRRVASSQSEETLIPSIAEYNNRQLFNNNNNTVTLSQVSTSSSSRNSQSCPICGNTTVLNTSSCSSCKRSFRDFVGPNSRIRSDVFYGHSALPGAVKRSAVDRRRAENSKPDCITIPDEDCQVNHNPCSEKPESSDIIEDIELSDELDSAKSAEIPVPSEGDRDTCEMPSADEVLPVKTDEIPMEVNDEPTVCEPQPEEDAGKIRVKKVHFGLYSCEISGIVINNDSVKFLNVPAKTKGSFRFNIAIPSSEMISSLVSWNEKEEAFMLIRAMQEASDKIEKALSLERSALHCCSPENKDVPSRFIGVEFAPAEGLLLKKRLAEKTVLPLEEIPYYLTKQMAKEDKDRPFRIVEFTANQGTQSENDGEPPVLSPGALRKSSRSTKPKPTNTTVIDLDDTHLSEDCPSKSTEVILSYPLHANDAIAIHKSDMECLKEGEFLNDSILDFYLKYISKELVDATLSSSVHIFSTFFYGKLCKNRRGDDNSKPIQQRYYDRVKRWTKSVDIFDHDFVIIPINKNYHWFVAILCYPSLVPDVKEASPAVKANIKITSGKRPCIIYMDSLGVAGVKNRLSDPIRHFLSMEWETKKGTQKSFTKGVLPDYFPCVPCQTNTTDCGLYVLQYIEEFLKNPAFVIDSLLQTHELEHWFPVSVINSKRKTIENLIYKLKQHVNQSEEAHQAEQPEKCEEGSPERETVDDRHESGTRISNEDHATVDAHTTGLDRLPVVITCENSQLVNSSGVHEEEADDDDDEDGDTVRKKQKIFAEIN